MVPESVRDYFYINPIVQMVQDARNFILGSSAGVETLWVDVDSIWLTIAPFAVILFFAVLGAWYFKRRSPYFAEDV